MLFEKEDTIVMAGDSVTDCGRMRESLPGGWGSFGEGYVNFVDAFLAALYPELHLMVANRGVSGDGIVQMASRWEKDVLDLNPDWVTVMIGINDVWRQFDGVTMRVKTIGPEEFEKCYRELLEKTLPRVKGMLLISPLMIESNDANPMKKRLREYIEIGRKLAAEYDSKEKTVLFVDTQKRIDQFLNGTGMNEYVLCSDRVHPNNKGHAIIAKAVLDAAGVDWSRGMKS